jgi:very-short-patch-repair endonuclease
MRHLPYNKNLKEFAKGLRNHSTVGEIKLWKQLRASGLGFQFYRQRIIENYIVDFYCPALRLVIEVDGVYHTHEEQQIEDYERQKILEELNLNFLRFTEKETMENVDMVIRTIQYYIEDRKGK